MNRSRKLKMAAVTLGLATAWGGTEAGAGEINSTATATIIISDASAFALGGPGSAPSNGTVTIGLADALGDSNFPGGVSLSSQFPFDLGPDDGYFFIGVSGPDLVLSFPNGGNGVIGEFWGALFIDPVRGGVTEDQILEQLAGSSFGVGEKLDPASPLGQLVADYGGLLRTPYGEESTLVAFTDNSSGPNNGEFAGTLVQSAIPEPMSLGLMISASGIVLGTRRRG